MTLEEQLSTIPINTLIEYHKAGFKLVPLARDSRTPNVQGILTPEEEIRSREESPDGQVHPVNYIYNHPEFWDEIRIQKEHWRFNNVATTFGKTHLMDEVGGALYLNALDIDSKQVFDSLATIRFNDKDRYFIDEMCKITNVTQTRRHIYWLSHKQYQPIRTRDCKPACALEIKTDKSTGLCTLPDSIHRDDPNFHYQSMGSNIISVQDGLYDGLVKELTDSLRQIKKPQGVAYCKSSDYSHNTNIIDDSDMISLSETNIAEIIAQLNQFYQKGLRDDFVYGLSGYLYKNKVKLESAEKIIDLLCQSTHDEEHKNRITVLHNTYKKADTGAPIAGYSPLIDILTRASDEHNAHSVLKNTSRILNIYRNPILSQLDNTVAQELSKHSFEVVCYSPFNFVIAHSEKRQILSGTINTAKRTEDNEKSEPIQYVQYGNVIIDAVPNKITRYENPSSIEIKYEMEFETPTGQFLKIQAANLEEILGYLKINGLVYKVRAAEEALPAILNAYYREGKMTVKREIETPGFYLINNKIEAYKAEHKQPTEEEIRKCAALLISLQSKYKRKEIFPTFLKWGIMAPFSYILKQIDGEQWMPWLFPYGWTNTGKTTNGKIVLAIWRNHKDKKKHDIGFSAADNVARFARAISYDTYPVLINEVQLNDDRQKQLVETLKHAVQSQTARARLMSRSVAEYISALSPCILTSNDLPPQDPAFRRRIIPIYYSKEDEPSQEEIEEFQYNTANWIRYSRHIGGLCCELHLGKSRDIDKQQE